MKKVKIRSRKALSVLLAMLMILTSVSVCFTCFAVTADITDALAEALKSDTVKNLSSYTTVTPTSTGSGGNVIKTNTTAINLATYAEYDEVVALLEKLDAAIKDSNQYKNYAAFGNDGSSRHCTDAGMIKDEIQQSLLDSGKITAAEYAEYNVDSFLGNVLSMANVDYTHDNNTGTKNSVPSRVYDVTTVSTSDYKGYLAEKNSVAEVDDSVVLSKKYTITMSRESYKTGLWNYHYHSVINTAYGVPTIEDNGSDTSIKATLNDYNTYLDSVNFSLSYEEMLDMVLNGTMDAFYNTFKEKYDAIVDYVGGVTVFEKLFSDRANAVNQMFKSCDSARDVQTYLVIAEQWRVFTDANPNYGIYNYGAYDHDAMVSAYENFMQIYSALEAGGDELLNYLNKHGEISLDYYNNFTDNIKAYDLAKVAESANALYEQVNDSYKELSAEEKQAAYSALSGYINAIGTYSEQVVNTFYPDGYQNLLDLQLELFCEVNENVLYFAKNTSTNFNDASTADIEALIAEVPEKLAGLHEFYDALVASAGADRAQALLGDLVAAADVFADSLYKLLADRFMSEVDYADSVYRMLHINEVNDIDSFLKLKAAFTNLEDDILVYLTDAGKQSLVSEQTITKYNNLKDRIYDSYLAFASTYGFSAYRQSKLDYESRNVYVNDKVKSEKYDVTAENLEATIEKLDSFLTSENFKNLIGGKSIAELLDGILSDAIYSDSFINTIVNLLYPLVLGEFDKVWSGLPLTVEYEGINVKVNYKKDLYAILHEGNLNIYPQLLGESLSDKYPQAKQALIDAKRNWKSVAIYDRDTEKLNLNWGVDEAEDKKTAFYDAFAAAMDGLKPLVMALLCGQDFSFDSSNIASGSVTILITITLNVALNLGATGNDGLVNALGPVFEALGYKNMPTAEEVRDYTTLQQVGKAILEPIFEIVSDIAKKPVDSVVSLLPNLIYALSFDMVTPILSMLKTRIGYTASANALGQNIKVLSDGVDIDLGTMLDLKSMGIDLSKGLQGILDLVGIEIPEIDNVTLATLGSLETQDTVRTEWIYDHSAIGDKAYTIKANKADVAYYLLTYIVDLLKDEDALKALLSKFVTDEAQVDSIVSTIASLGLNTTGDVVAALVELVNAEKYPQSTFSWPAIEAPQEPETPVEGEEEEDTFYTQWWTADKAKYVSDNLIPFVTKLAGILGYDISEVVTDLISTLYTKENLVKLVDLVNGLLAKVNEDETIASIIEIVDPLINIDVQAILNALASYQVPDFEGGDRDAFVNALVDYIKPIVPVLKLLLVDSADNSELVIADIINVFGYNGYDNALIPVLEAIGCDPADITKYDEFIKLDDTAMVKAVLNPILKLIDKISADPIDGIIGLLPNILYFIDFGGLQMAIDNLLEPVYVVLDVIRPIYNADLTVNLNIDEILTDLLAKANIKSIGYSDISSTIKMLGDQKEYVSANGSQASYLVVEETMTPEFITVLLRMLIKTFVFSDNADRLVEYIRNNNEGISEQAINDISNLLHALADIGEPDQILYVLFYVFFGLNTGVTEIDNAFTLVSKKMQKAFEAFDRTTSEEVKGYIGFAADFLQKLLASIGGDDIPGGPTGFLAKIISFFQRILEWFKKVFKVNF